MNARGQSQQLINEFMDAMEAFPDRMVPIGPIESLQMKFAAALEAKERERDEANSSLLGHALVVKSLRAERDQLKALLKEALSLLEMAIRYQPTNRGEDELHTSVSYFLSKPEIAEFK